MKYYLIGCALIIYIIGCNVEEPKSPPVVRSIAATNITLKNASISGEVISEGYSAVSERGLVISETNPKPSVSDIKYSSGYGIGTFSKDLENLKVNTKYYFSAYAVNTKGTAYGEYLNFTTADYKLSTISLEEPKNISFNSVQLTSTISDDGGSGVSDRGFVISNSSSPTIANIKIPNESGIGSFSTVITELKEETNYYARSYATNGKGIAYSNEIKFSTLGFKAPAVETGIATNIGSEGATLNGDIINNGGVSLSEKGFILGTNSNVGLNEQKVKSLYNNAGKYSVDVTNLKPNMKYYYKAYAINSKGTTLGSESNFITTEFQKSTTTEVVEIKSAQTGRIWMDRNLGAKKADNYLYNIRNYEDAYGDLYQWGRLADGHQFRTSAVTTSDPGKKSTEETTKWQSNTDVPNYTSFFTTTVLYGIPDDWRNPQNNNLWQGVNGINNPCPQGFRIPTLQEFQNEFQSAGSNRFRLSPVLLYSIPIAGLRYNDGRFYESSGTNGFYWTSNVFFNKSTGFYDSYAMYVDGTYATITTLPHTFGASCRCIKD